MWERRREAGIRRRRLGGGGQDTAERDRTKQGDGEGGEKRERGAGVE